MWKRLPLTALLMILVSPFPAMATTFGDVAGTPYEEAYSYLSAEGVVQGVNGAGLPNDRLNRVEALKVILDMDAVSRARVQYYARHMPPLPLFTDVDQSSWYAPYIEAAFADGLITGYPDGTFHPEYPVRTEEAVALLLRAHNRSTVALTASLPQDSGDRWYGSYIADAAKKNLFAPTDALYIGYALSRGQFFNIAYRLDSLRKKKVDAFPGPSGSAPVEPAGGAVVPVAVSVSGGTAPAASSVAAVSAPALAESTYYAISLPSIGINDLRISRPDDPFSHDGILAPLKSGVGNLFGYPGSGTKIMIYGHSSDYAWNYSKYSEIFTGINKLNIGDRVYVNYHGTVYTYEVTSKETVPASDTSRFQGDGEELILYTCWPPKSIKQRYLVHAVPVKD